MTLWQWIISLLVWLSADPVVTDLEHSRAAAAVAVARASMADDHTPPAPGPTPTACDCGQTCVRGVWLPDGRVQQTCKCACPRCVAERAKAVPCPDGKCRIPGASPAQGSPARP